MAEVQQPSNAQETNDVVPLIDDEAYLMSMVEADALLPSNMTFSGLFDGALNADELTDIASLLAPSPPNHVSDDETGSSVASSEASTPVSAAPVLVTPDPSKAPAPLLPELEAKSKPSLVSAAAANHKRRSLSKDPAPSKKKAKLAPKTKLILASSVKASVPKQLVPCPVQSSDVPGKTNDDKKIADPLATNGAEKFPALAPKPPAPKPLKTPAALTLKAAIAPCIEQPDEVASDTATSPKTSDTSVTDTSVTETKTTGTNSSKPLTQEERAQQCRDRNRQHARNTRLRKKAYIEELKTQLIELVDARDAEALEQAQKTKIVEQQREVRFQVMQDFLQIRGRNEANPTRWGAILEDGFTLTLPKTPFQTMVATTTTTTDKNNDNADHQEQLLSGVAEIMTDSTYFSSFLQSLGNATHTHTTTTGGDDANIPPITFVYRCNRSNFLMDGCNAIISWTATSAGAVQKGAAKELELCGSMRAKFCPRTNRLEMAKIQFDTGAIQSQL
ncbi:expressed unknown protein [Seminavis robusta]|uniref:BZIP domain-containing protein n=1 Tax=Seminavis robusta TaxID=568900 RepID=A0A9N8HTE3_9STRA|nr:expressed unknown protein [Seminavis robusta]|eukprot:Sro1864_g302400.1 n/a (504) ;mRNA; r:11358-13197